MTEKTKKDKTTLEQFKQIEAKKKEVLLKRSLKHLKECAEQVLRWKATMNEYLLQLDINTKDQKAIVDWINSLIELSKDDLEGIKDEVKDSLKGQKEKIEEPDNTFCVNTANSVSGATAVLRGGTVTTTCDSNLVTSFCNVSSSDIK